MAECLLDGARNFAGIRVAELSPAAGDVAYSAVSMATLNRGPEIT